MQDFPLRLRHPGGQMMTLERDRLLVSFSGEQAPADADSILDRLGLVPEPDTDVREQEALGRRPLEVLNRTETRSWARTAEGTAFRASRFERTEGVDWVGPVYRVEMGGRTEFLAVLPHALVIHIDQQKESEILKELSAFGLPEEDERSKLLPGLVYLVLRDPVETSALDLRMRLLEEKPAGVLEVHPELMPMYVPTAFVPNDPLFGSQWDMQRISAGGTGQTAWNLERGDAAIIICVLDTGCDLAHPDLTFAATGINLGSMSGNGGPTGNHGTACAGIAAAKDHNGTGVAGVAGDCGILPVAFQDWTDVEVAAGITYATNHGARVISMSFGWNPWNHAIIDPAIQYAFDHNVVMCVATHNYNGPITYPATNPLVMAVGASDQVDNRKTPSSPDGETWWGSDFGLEISVVAPGVQIPTTDRQGAVGYTGTDYFMMFNGTSSATPHVAGLAALVISCDPTLTNVEVRNVIEQTCDKVGVLPYAATPAKPNGTWNQEMGYGRINAYKAVQSVCKRWWFDHKWRLIDKPVVLDVKPIYADIPPKLERFKEKERIDEVKSIVGLENPTFDPTIFEHIMERLDALEQRVNQGRSFIPEELRPQVGSQIAGRTEQQD
jgi:subtilisin family serine protease